MNLNIRSFIFSKQFKIEKNTFVDKNKYKQFHTQVDIESESS
jgi:hypothetical protein